jgi:hypothetical protein
MQTNPGAFTEYGPTITVDENNDEIDVPLNVVDYNSFLMGEQFMLIRHELLYIREFLQVSGTQWQARGCLRCRLNSGDRVQSSAAPNSWPRHTAGEAVYIIPQANVRTQTNSLINTGGATFVKSQAINEQGAQPLASVAPAYQTMRMLGTKPPPLPWVAAGDNGRRDFRHADTQDIVFQVMKPAKSGGAGVAGGGTPSTIVEFDDTDCSLVLEVYFEDIVGPPGATFDDLDAMGSNALQETWTLPFSGLTKKNNVYYATITEASIPNYIHAAYSDEQNLDEPPFPWKWLAYFSSSGTRSEPVEIRLSNI